MAYMSQGDHYNSRHFFAIWLEWTLFAFTGSFPGLAVSLGWQFPWAGSFPGRCCQFPWAVLPVSLGSVASLPGRCCQFPWAVLPVQKSRHHISLAFCFYHQMLSMPSTPPPFHPSLALAPICVPCTPVAEIEPLFCHTGSGWDWQSVNSKNLSFSRISCYYWSLWFSKVQWLLRVLPTSR